MRAFRFSTTYRGSPQVAMDLLLRPQELAERMPYVRRVDILNQLSPDSLEVSWEIEVDGAVITWREQIQRIRAEKCVRFVMSRGDFRAYSGEWRVSLLGDTVTVTLVAEVDWGAPNLSQFVAAILEKKVEKALHGMVLAAGRAAVRRILEQKRTSKRFGFIFHPLDLQLFAEGFEDEDLRTRRSALVEQVMAWFPPFRRSVVDGIRSPLGGDVEGDMILFPLLPKQMIGMNGELVLARLVEAGRLAQSYGDKIIGLGAYASIVGRKGVLLAKQLSVPVTTGSSYTIAIAIEATMMASQEVGCNLHEATVAVIGATGTIGCVCAQLMAAEARHLVLVARNQQKLEDVSHSISKQGKATVATLTDLESAIRNADIVITATSTPTAIIDVTKLKPGTLVCDISRPRNISEEDAMLRPDVLILDGGVVQPPGEPNFHFSFGLPQGLAYGCMAETMLLALEGRYEAYSLGGNVNDVKVSEIAQLGRKHGFTLAGLRSFEKGVSKEQLDRVREVRTKLRRKRLASVQQA